MLRMVRFANKGGKRSYDRAQAVNWNISVDAVNKRVVVQTEQTRYYTTDEWLFDFISSGKEEGDAEVTILKRKSGKQTLAGHKKPA